MDEKTEEFIDSGSRSLSDRDTASNTHLESESEAVVIGYSAYIDMAFGDAARCQS